MLHEIQAWIERCKAFLALGEYEISVALDPDLEALGTCLADPTYQTASIALRDPSAGAHPDWQRTVLHELVHVRMGGALGTEDGTEERSALERGVEMMTRVIYKMIKGGASSRSPLARLCARSITTAREGNEVMMSARIAEIAMTLGGMDLPEEAKTLVTELIGLASGSDVAPESEIVAPEKEEPIVPVVASDPAQEKMYRAALGDKGWETFKATAQKTARAATMNLARAELGAGLTPADEQELARMSPSEAQAFIKGLKRAGRGAPAAQTINAHKPGNGPPVKDKKAVEISTLLRPGESLDGAAGTKRVATEVLETRAATRGLTIGKVA